MPGTRSPRRSAARAVALPPAPRAHFALPPRAHDALSDPERARLLECVRDVLALPTAPYAEDAQVRGLLAFAAARPGIDARLDPHGNAILTWKGKRRGPPLAYSAHLDHPGVELVGRVGRAHRARLHGGVRSTALPGAPIRFFALDDGRATATARVRSAHGRELVLTDVRGELAPRAPGMWDFTPGRVRGSRLAARVCDDLLGAVAILFVLDRLWRERSEAGLVGVFTRAEETGFVGCLGLVRSRALRRDTRVIGLECSPLRASARPGRGAVVRVGDAASVFDPELTHALQRCAGALRASVPGLSFQRALMDGGRCESTAYNAHDIRAGAACLALGNYHNCTPRGRLAPEWVEWADLESLAALLAEFALSWNTPAAHAQPRASLEPLWTGGRADLARSARRIRSAATRSAHGPLS